MQVSWDFGGAGHLYLDESIDGLPAKRVGLSGGFGGLAAQNVVHATSMQTETTERIEIADARLEADGERVSLDLHAMDCTTTTDYEVGPLPGERTAGTKRRSAELEWNSTRTWDLLAKMHGGEQRLMDREFSLVVTEAGDEILDGEDAPEPRTFRQVRFHGRDRISYLSEG